MVNKWKALEVARKLARTERYQTVYAQEKLHLRIFENDMDLSYLQFFFLDYVSFYHNLFVDLALKKIDERVFENEIYEDSYVYYKNHKKEDKQEKNQRPQDINTKDTYNNSTRWVFKRNTPKK